MKNKKIVLGAIIFLLIIFVPLTIMGYFVKDKKNPLEENPNHEFYFENKLWFYDNNDKLISSYECQTNKCDLATLSIDDEEYGLNYYKEGTLKKVGNNNSYTFIGDGALNYLYDIKNGRALQKYLQIKNYNTKIKNDVYIIQNEKKLWGAISIEENLRALVPFDYEFLGIINNISNGELQLNYFVALKNGEWFLVDKENTKVSSELDSPIVDYNEEYIITKKDNRVKVYSYVGNEFLDTFYFNDYALYDKYIGLVTNDTIYIYNNLNSTYLKSIPNNKSGKLTLEPKGNQVVIKLNEEVIDYLN